MIWKCVIVDDEPEAREVLKRHIQHIPTLHLVSEQPHAIGAIDFLHRHSVDLLFVDIEMPQVTGIELVKTLPVHPRIIFTTAHKDYAWDGFELGAVDFLLKPIAFDRFLKAVQRITLPSLPAIPPEQTEHVLYFRADRRMIKVPVNEILYIESLKDYVKVILPEKQIITKQTITTVEDMLPPRQFLRVHRSYIVQEKKIDSYSSHSIFIGKDEIPIGPLYRLDVMRKLNPSF
ncbi:MAG: LytR/AlgR family response regulator transcription factor [Bacteroidota bacterium]